jgi:polysaccharide chain length determinant protein (PEP-CTERM system associated)
MRDECHTQSDYYKYGLAPASDEFLAAGKESRAEEKRFEMIQREWTAEDYIRIVRRRWILILTISVVGAGLAYGVSRFLPKRYKSQTLVLVEPPTVPTDFVRPVVSEDINSRLVAMQEQILSRSRLEPIIQQFKLYSEDVNRAPMPELVELLRKQIEVSPMTETRATNLPGFTVSVTSEDPVKAQEVCAAVTSMFIQESIRVRQQHSEDTTQFLAQQLTDAKGKLDEQDAKLAAFKSRFLGLLPDQEATNLNILMGLSSQLASSTESLFRTQQDRSVAESMLAQQLAAWHATKTPDDPETLEQTLASLQSQLANLQARYTDSYPDVIKTKRDIAAIQQRVADVEAQKKGAGGDKLPPSREPMQITQLRAQIKTDDQVIAEKTKEQNQIKDQIKVLQVRVQSSPVIEQQYKQVTRDYQTALDFYNDLLKKRAESAMSSDLERRQEGEQFTLLDPANLPDQPSYPNPPLFALGGFGGGLGLGLGLALLLEMRDTSLRSEKDVESVLRLPVLAMIPAIDNWSGNKVQTSASRMGIGSKIGVGAGA